MKVIPIVMQDGFTAWSVINEADETIEPVFQYLTYPYNLQKSPNTVRAYAHHLRHFWEYLESKTLDWTAVKLDDLAAFITWLRSPSKNVISIHQAVSKRTESSINAGLAAVAAFYKFQEQIGNIKNLDRYTSKIAINTKYKPFLHHLNTTRRAKTSLLKIKVSFKLPRTINRELVEQMLTHCYYQRDKLLISYINFAIRLARA